MHPEKLCEPLFMAFIFTRLLWTKNLTEVRIVLQDVPHYYFA